jgi:TPR repeat protein
VTPAVSGEEETVEPDFTWGCGYDPEPGQHAALEEGARRGNAAALFWLAQDYMRGTCVKRDESRARELTIEACRGGEPRARNLLAKWYLAGWWEPHDWAETAAWLREPAIAGDAESQWLIGLIYAREDSPAADSQLAVEWWLRAGLQDHCNAQVELADAYFGGELVKADPGEARRWALKASTSCSKPTNNHGRYARILSDLYFAGLGVQRDYGEAIAWARVGAREGEAWALNRLVRVYSEGRGVPIDPIEAYKWTLLREAFRPRITGAQLSEAIAGESRRDLSSADLGKAHQDAGDWAYAACRTAGEALGPPLPCMAYGRLLAQGYASRREGGGACGWYLKSLMPQLHPDWKAEPEAYAELCPGETVAEDDELPRRADPPGTR